LRSCSEAVVRGLLTLALQSATKWRMEEVGSGGNGDSATGADPELKRSASALLAGRLTHLRSIKDMEMKWLDRFSAITLPAIGFLVYS